MSIRADLLRQGSASATIVIFSAWIRPQEFRRQRECYAQQAEYKYRGERRYERHVGQNTIAPISDRPMTPNRLDGWACSPCAAKPSARQNA
jgi:hypothetical protein